MPLSHVGHQERHLGNYTVANLPTTSTQGVVLTAGDIAFATNGRAAAEGPGAGTGTLCVWNGTAWRRIEDMTAVQS